LLVLATVFSCLCLVGLLTLAVLAIWAVRQLQVIGQPKLLISQPRTRPAPTQTAQKDA